MYYCSCRSLHDKPLMANDTSGVCNEPAVIFYDGHHRCKEHADSNVLAAARGCRALLQGALLTQEGQLCLSKALDRLHLGR